MTYGQAKTVLVAAAVIALAGCGASAATADSAATVGASTPAASATSPAATSPAASSPAASSPASSSPAAAAGGSGNFKAACPSTATVAAATGESYPAPKQTNSGGELTCSYNNSSDVLVVGFTSYPGATGNDVKLAMAAQAKGLNAPDHAIPGLGEAAYGFTTTNGTTIIEMLVGSEIVVVTGISTSAAGVQTLARDIAG